MYGHIYVRVCWAYLIWFNTINHDYGVTWMMERWHFPNEHHLFPSKILLLLHSRNILFYNLQRIIKLYTGYYKYKLTSQTKSATHQASATVKTTRNKEGPGTLTPAEMQACVNSETFNPMNNIAYNCIFFSI